MVPDNQPIRKPRNIKVKSCRPGGDLSFHLIRKTIAQTIKIPILYTVHDLYDLLITYV